MGLKVLVHCCIVLKTSQKVPSLEACKYGLICNLLNKTIYISNFITPRSIASNWLNYVAHYMQKDV